MANQEDKKPGTPDYTGLVAVLVLFFSAVWVQYTPLTTSRPPAEEIPELAPTGVKARLWQDPFTAVQRQLAEPPANLRAGICSQALPGEALQQMAKDTHAKIVALGVMIQETNWESMEELQGRRQRYAVLAALNRLGYLPDDADKLKCLISTENGENGNPLVIPYEVFTKKGSDAEKVALFWLNELAFEHKPLGRIRKLFRSAGEEVGTIRIVGPWASGTVRDLLDEAQKLDQDSKTGQPSLLPLHKLAFLSSSATAPDQDLLPVDHRDEALPEFLNSKGIFFERITSTDDKLVRSLAEELALRGLDSDRVKAGKAYLALISEWDTLYAQTLPQAFKRELGVEEQCKGNGNGCPILQYSYLRGLDGLLPGKGQADSARQRENNKEAKKDSAAVEKPQGDGQADYLRRLTDRLSDQERLLRDQGKELKAIGVFGNDVYDKLLVLKALRARFPARVLFTTDLDAAYLHPEEFKSETHNLIAASSFGLTLNPYLQGSIPPFRDSYQTGTFLAAQFALSLDRFVGGSIENPDQRTKAHIKIAEWFPDEGPRVFEIGRTEAVSLNSPADGQSGFCTLVDCQSVHPTSGTWMDKSGHGGSVLQLAELYAGLIVLAALLWLLLCLLWRGARRATRNTWRWLSHHTASAFVGFMGLLALFAWMNYLAFFATDQEPFSWFDGVSMWPAQLIRLTTLLLVVVLLRRGWLLIRWNDFVISRRFFPDARRRTIFASVPAKQSLLDDLKDYWREITRVKPEPETPLSTWIEHVHPRGLRARMICAVIPSVVFYMFGVIVLSPAGLPLERPYRGEAFGALDLVILFSTLFAVLVLTFFVAEATSRCNRMAQQLKKAPNWPPATLATLGLTDGSTGDSQTAPVKPHGCVFDPLLDMQLIAERTDVLSGLIYYPFLALALFIASRTPLFDNWHTPWQLALLLVLSFAVPVICALRLRNNAEGLRRIALEKLSMCLLAQKGSDNSKLSEQLEEAIKQVKSMEKGAFKPFTQQPWLRALFLPLSSWSGLTIIEFLIRANF